MEEITSVKNAVQKANQEMHSKLAATYNEDEPHWRPENIERVSRKVLELIRKTGSAEKLLDLGCGTGFMIEIAKKLGFREIYGVDITQEMIDRIDRSGASKITIELGDTGNTSAPSDYFDVVTAYTFMSHLDELDSTISQAYRCLSKGGIFYSDLDPNAYFWKEIYALKLPPESYHHYISREIKHTANNDTELETRYGVPKDVYNLAEYQKTNTKGFEEEYLIRSLKKAGFDQVKIEYNWFVGQGIILNDSAIALEERMQKIKIIDEFLISSLPLSRVLYKYISITALK